MKKLFLLLLGFGMAFANPFYENFRFDTKIEEVDLKDYTQVENAKYSLSKGYVFEKDVVYLGQNMKQVLKFSEAGVLDMFFFINESKHFEDNLNEAPEENMKFAKGRVELGNNFYDFSYEEQVFFGLKISDIELDFYNTKQQLKVNSMYIKGADNIKDFEKTYAITNMKICSAKDKHKECSQCEYLEGMDTDVNCVNKYIYHKPIQ